MKIDIHSTVMGWVTSPCFYESAKENLPKLVENYYKNKKVKRIQFYSDFYNTDGNYPYIKNDLVHYPLTIIFYNNCYEVLWVSWNYLGRKKEEIHKFPFTVFENITFMLCDDVESDFKNSIKGKKTCLFKKQI